MNQDWDLAGDYSVEIWFRIAKDEHGYPESKRWEQLLARPLMERDDYFRVESIPFYLKNVSCGDIVKANIVENTEIQKGKIFQFEDVIYRGGHNTYRLLVRKKHPKDPRFTTDELLGKGLMVEEQYGDFFAVDVPPTVDQYASDDYLRGQRQAGRWEMQDGYIDVSITAYRQNKALR